MRIIKKVTIDEIEKHLLLLGGGNHPDNMKQVYEFQNRYLAELTKDDYLNLVFLDSPSTKELIQIAKIRTLKKMGEAANTLNGKKLGTNWDLTKIISDTKIFLETTQGLVKFPAFLLRSSKNDESKLGDWYLQDGSHRALGYAMYLLDNTVDYTIQQTYIVADKELIIENVA
ncbi:MAG: hypothetical protein WC209_18375 [Ignavibacteriaceae bacterium]|jgi:hypothetical protein